MLMNTDGAWVSGHTHDYGPSQKVVNQNIELKTRSKGAIEGPRFIQDQKL